MQPWRVLPYRLMTEVIAWLIDTLTFFTRRGRHSSNSDFNRRNAFSARLNGRGIKALDARG
jgi:hypothetical protein